MKNWNFRTSFFLAGTRWSFYGGSMRMLQVKTRRDICHGTISTHETLEHALRCLRIFRWPVLAPFIFSRGKCISMCPIYAKEFSSLLVRANNKSFKIISRARSSCESYFGRLYSETSVSLSLCLSALEHVEIWIKISEITARWKIKPHRGNLGVDTSQLVEASQWFLENLFVCFKKVSADNLDEEES